MKKVFSLGIAMMLFVSSLVSSGDSAAQQSAAQSTLQQEILAIDCTHTSPATSSGMQNDPACPPFAPTINQIESREGRPLISGVYDAVHTSQFRVMVAGVWYTLGVDPELTTNGNAWQLDLGSLSAPLQEGQYEVRAEATHQGGQILSAIQTFTIVQPGNPSVPGGPDTGVAAIFRGFGVATLAIMFITGLALLVAVAYRRHRR